MPSITAYKCFTSRLGSPIWNGALPYVLPEGGVDTSKKERSAGWSACATAEDALRIGGLWPNGRPSRLFRVETDQSAIALDTELHASTWTIVEEVDVAPAVATLSQHWFGAEAPMMAREQLLWRAALARPQRDVMAVEEGLRSALEVRGLPWQLRRFDAVRDVWSSWDAWDSFDAGDALGDWGVKDDVWSAVWKAWEAWEPWGSTRNVMNPWHTWVACPDAMSSLVHRLAIARGWITELPDQYTIGIRDAYLSGLGTAIPTGPRTLGWAMEERP